MLAVSLSGPGGEYMRRPVTRWNHDDVMSWVGGLGNWAHHNVTRAFTKEVSVILHSSCPCNVVSLP